MIASAPDELLSSTKSSAARISLAMVTLSIQDYIQTEDPHLKASAKRWFVEDLAHWSYPRCQSCLPFLPENGLDIINALDKRNPKEVSQYINEVRHLATRLGESSTPSFFERIHEPPTRPSPRL